MSEWNPVVAELANVVDRLSELLAMVAAFGGSKIKVQPRPRPHTAIDREKSRKREQDHLKLVDRLLPGRPN